MLKIAVLGAGHLGKIHIQQILELRDQYELVGFYDPSPETQKQVQEKFGVKAFDNMEDLIDLVDAVDIVTPTLAHFDCASKALKKFKHIFIEKPITNTVQESKILLQLAREANVKVQVGHVERFNPAFQAVADQFNTPMFIEAHRLAEFNPRGTDVSVVLDLMIHDIDVILSVVNSSVKKISASGVAVISDTPDLANARIEFDNGCVANLTASRISLKNMRKARFFQKDAYISVDFYAKESEIVKMKEVEGEGDPFALTIDLGEGKGSKQIYFDKPEIEPVNAIQEELKSFAHAIENNLTPPVSIEQACNALDVAHQIVEKVHISSSFMTHE